MYNLLRSQVLTNLNAAPPTILLPAAATLFSLLDCEPFEKAQAQQDTSPLLAGGMMQYSHNLAILRLVSPLRLPSYCQNC